MFFYAWYYGRYIDRVQFNGVTWHKNIFLQLSYEDLEKCGLVNQTSKKILENENPIFWHKKLIRQAGLFSKNSKKTQSVWAEIIKQAKGSDKEKYMCKYLSLFEHLLKDGTSDWFTFLLHQWIFYYFYTRIKFQ